MSASARTCHVAASLTATTQPSSQTLAHKRTTLAQILSQISLNLRIPLIPPLFLSRSKMAKKPELYDDIGKSIAPAIYGHQDIKKALA